MPPYSFRITGELLRPASHQYRQSAISLTDIHSGIHQVQQMEAFRPKAPGLLESMLARFPRLQALVNTLGHQWENLLDTLRQNILQFGKQLTSFLPEQIQHLFSFVMTVLVLMVGLIVLYWLLGILLHWKKDKTTTALQATQPASSSENSLQDTASHYQRALLLAEQSCYSSAIRQLYLASLCVLQEKQQVVIKANQTSGDVLQTLRAIFPDSPAGKKNQDNTQSQVLLHSFSCLARQFERSHFGSGLAGMGMFQQCLTHFEELKAVYVSGR
jgi:hypothetical protein